MWFIPGATPFITYYFYSLTEIKCAWTRTTNVRSTKMSLVMTRKGKRERMYYIDPLPNGLLLLKSW